MKAIPGYIFDEKKQRYYKVKHGSSHVKDLVKKNRSKLRVCRQDSSSLKDILHRELGAVNRSLPAKAWGHQPIRQIWAPTNYQVYGGISSFAISPQRSLLVGSSCGMFGQGTSENIFTPIHKYLTPICSVLTNDNVVAAVWRGSSDVVDNAVKPSIYFSSVANMDENGFLGSTVVLQNKEYVLSADIGSQNNDMLFGLDQSCAVMSERQSKFDFKTFSTNKKSAFSVNWRSNQVFLAGCRNGFCFLYDLRKPAKQMPVLKHPSSIYKSKVLDNYLIVAGLEHTLAMYDFRMPSCPGSLTSKEILRYQGHNNSHNVNLGFDVSPELGIIAVASDNASLMMWSLDDPFPIHSGCNMQSKCHALRFEGDSLFISSDTSVYSIGVNDI